MKLANALAKDGMINASKQMIKEIKKDIIKYQNDTKNSIMLKMKDAKRTVSMVEP